MQVSTSFTVVPILLRRDTGQLIDLAVAVIFIAATFGLRSTGQMSS